MMVDPQCHSSMQFHAYFMVFILVFAESLSFSHNRLHNTKNHKRQTFCQTAVRNLAEGASIRTNDAIHPGNRLIVFGLGNIGTLVARTSALERDDRAPFFRDVYGTTRSGKEIAGVRAIDFDSHRELEEIIPSCTHILVTIPPVDPPSTSAFDDEADAALLGGRPGQCDAICDPVLNNPAFRRLVPANAWVGYVSSTSVYGNHDGEWVDEDSEAKCQPGTKGELYYRAENEWRESARAHGWRLHVFRSSGLYGDGRSAIHTIRRRGDAARPVDGDAASERRGPRRSLPTSRIHEEDASRAIASAMAWEGPGAGDRLWNLADDEPAPRDEVMEFGAKLLGEANFPPPDEVGSGPSSAKPRQSERATRRRTDRKRVGNRRMKDLLLPDGKLLYPTYREGLRAVLDYNRKEWSLLSEQC